MNFPFYIAKRYLFKKKSQNVINIISTISVVGVGVCTMVLIIILSVFNGFDSLITSLFHSFDADLKITVKEGKSFTIDNEAFEKIKNLEGVAHFSEIVEENALLKYHDKQYVATVKGVSDEFVKMSGIDSMIIEGEFFLKHNNKSFAVIGQGIAYYLSVGLNFVTPINIYVPKRAKKVTFNPEKAFNKVSIFPIGIFAIQQDFDSKYIIVPIEFTRKLLDYTNEVSAVELKFKPGLSGRKNLLQKEIRNILGEKYEVKNRYQQHELLYKVMKSEKLAIFLILSFILLIASFNIIGSLTMLIIDKNKDISTLRSLGANLKTIRNIFLIEGWMISIIGALSGLFVGAFVCWLQLKFGIISLYGTGSFIIDHYPVEMHFSDFISVLIIVLFIGFFAAWYPVRYITRRYINLRIN